MNFQVFRDNLQSLVKSHGLTMRQFGIETGITSATLSRYLSETRVPDLQYVMRIAAYFNVSIDWLVGFSDNKYSLLPEGVREFATLYQIASEDDRKVVQAVLYKYKGKTNAIPIQ